MTIFGCKKPDFEAIEQLSAFEDFFKTRKIYSLKVDMRSATAFEAGHLAHAVHVPLGPAFTSEVLALLEAKNAPKDVLLFLYGGAEMDMTDAVATLKPQVGQKPFRSRINKIYYLNAPYVEP